MSIIEWLWIGIVPCVMIFGIIMKRFIPKVSVPVLVLVFSLVSSEMLFYTMFRYSALSYLGLLLTVLGIIMLFYNYKINHFYSVRQFLWRWIYAFSNIMILVWLMLAIYRIILFFIK